MSDFAYLKTGSGLTVHFMDGASYTWTNDHPKFAEAIDIIKAGGLAADLQASMDVKKHVAVATQKFGDFEVTDDGVSFRGNLLNMSLTQRIIDMVREGFDAKPMLNFLQRLLKNPRREAVLSLYDFMEHNKLPINPDGTFVAYKIVRKDYKDIYSGKFDNSIGQSPEMLPFEVDGDRNQTCSAGLHVCSKDYLPHYGAGGSRDRIMIVRVDPEHVVAVPRDYNNAKMRVWKYDVIGEMAAREAATILEQFAVLSPSARDEAEKQGFAWGDNVASSDDNDAAEWDEMLESEQKDNGNVSGYLHDFSDDHTYEAQLSDDGSKTLVTASVAESLVRGYHDVWVSHGGELDLVLIENDFDEFE